MAALYQIAQILFWLVLFGANIANAANIFQRYVETPGKDNPLAIVIEGSIKKGDEVVFRNLLDGTAEKATEVHLRSDGGMVNPALSIGRMIRARRMTTVADHYCVSSCGLIWLSGEKLQVTKGAYLGFHAAYDRSGKVAAVANALIGGFINELGYEQAVIRYATMAQPAGMNYLTMSEAVIMGLNISFTKYTVLPEIKWKDELDPIEIKTETEPPKTEKVEKTTEELPVSPVYKAPRIAEVKITGQENWYKFHKDDEPGKTDFEKAFRKQQEAQRRREEIEKPDFIRAVQTELNRLKCHAGEVDGMWGGNTMRAVQEFARLTQTKYSSLVDLDTLLLEMRKRTDPVCSLNCVEGYAKVSDGCQAYPLTKLKRYLRRKKAEKAAKNN